MDGICVFCKKHYRENWPQKRTAILCGAPGDRHGFVCEVVPESVDPRKIKRAAPLWCPGFQEF